MDKDRAVDVLRSLEAQHADHGGMVTIVDGRALRPGSVIAVVASSLVLCVCFVCALCVCVCVCVCVFLAFWRVF